MAKAVPQMIRGLGMGVRLLSLLIEETDSKGGTVEMLHFLTTDAGRENLEKVVELIVSLKWTIPGSLVMRMVEETSLQDNDSSQMYADWDQLFSWSKVLESLKIPITRFMQTDPSRKPWIPDEIREQLHDKRAYAGTVITWEDRQYILAGIVFDDGRITALNEPLDLDETFFVDIAPADHFDLSR
ncbi:MAG TPA: hypothetical protein VJA87_02870 [Candidatus Paceibacterota bacterium]